MHATCAANRTAGAVAKRDRSLSRSRDQRANLEHSFERMLDALGMPAPQGATS